MIASVSAFWLGVCAARGTAFLIKEPEYPSPAIISVVFALPALYGLYKSLGRQGTPSGDE
jgi:hypothetical protein